MTETLISLISIFIGIIGANSTGFFFRQYSFGVIGNTILGVFGSIFFIKFISRLGFDPIAIMRTGEVNITLFFINMFVSLTGGAVGLILTKLIIKKLNKA
ncbi:hypothetical protein [Aureibaculum luteum]|uniref:hypothetical protein n=1 Tax=Aureibaculum luteum TaxID=1548456 RepID=UPI000E54C08B|nr:hypothetical protein [Aureibaculum luteum]